VWGRSASFDAVAADGSRMDPSNTCPSCRRRELIDFDMALRDATKVRMRVCPPCHVRWWEHDGRRLARDEMLALVAEHSQRPVTGGGTTTGRRIPA